MRRLLIAFSCLVLSGHAAFVRMPYVQNLTDSSIVVLWQTSSPETGLVQYGLSLAYGLESPDPNPATGHELQLAGLAPDTLYYYRAISGPDTSPGSHFHTPVGPNKPFRFMAYGDNRTDSAAHQTVVDRMALVSPDPGLMLNVGDLTATGSAANYRTFFNIEQDLVNRMPLFPVLGNHDIGNMANWFANLALPDSERWYSVRYGNSAFVCLDNNSTYTPGSAQYDWLVAEFLADSADPSVRHIFVIFHSPPYTTNNGHASDTLIRRYLCPLFERFHVPIAFQGHNHCYEHSLVNGVHYIITGGGGAPLHTSWGEPQPWTVYREPTLEFVLVSVSADTIVCQAVKPDGAVFDSFAIFPPSTAVSEPGAVPVQFDPGLAAEPNPLRDQTRISFTLRATGYASLALYDAAGNLRATILNRVLPAGRHDRFWRNEDLPEGSYLLVLKTPFGSVGTRLVIQR